MNDNIVKYEMNENIVKKINDFNKAILFSNNKNFYPQFTDIKKEIKNRNRDIRKYFDIKDTVFKEMQSKQNSLIYQELVKNMGKYFFGPNGKITQKYKYLHDYYEAKESKMGLNSKICAGTLDYFSLLSSYDSYSQRLNSTKEQLLFSSSNLSVARSGIDIIDQNALAKNKLFNKRKNFVNINIKHLKDFYRNNTNQSGNTNTNTNNNTNKSKITKMIIPKIKLNSDENKKINDKNRNIKLYKIKTNPLKNDKINLTNELTYSHISPKYNIIDRYSNETIIKDLKQKLYIHPYDFPLSPPYNKINFEEKKKKIKFLPEINIKENLTQKMKPIIYLNRNSLIDLSFIKNIKMRSKNDRNAKRLILKKNLSDRFFDKSDFSYNKLPSLQSITLSKKMEKLKGKKKYEIDYDD